VIVIDETIDEKNVSNGCALESASGGSIRFPPAIQRLLRAQPFSPLSKPLLTVPISFLDVVDGEVCVVQAEPRSREAGENIKEVVTISGISGENINREGENNGRTPAEPASTPGSLQAAQELLDQIFRRSGPGRGELELVS
jgi:hypothetical protein